MARLSNFVAQFLALAPATQQTYRLILERFRQEHGNKPLVLLTREHVNAMLAQRVSTPAAAVHGLRAADLSREPARHRSVSACAKLQASPPASMKSYRS